MIELRDKQILIEGEPRLIVGGEIHYFRIGRDEWQDRIDKLKAAGGNAVASYIPWLCHEVREGEFDFAGRTRPELDLAGFVDLCRENGLWFFARPGPFVMAELKNEGLPYRLYEQHPEIVPVSWDGKRVPSRTVDYLAPAFLEEVRRWYEAVADVLVSRLHPNGGNVIAVQLDNEVGMLSWLTNSPDLTDLVVADFWAWLEQRYEPTALARRYPPDRFGPTVRDVGIRSPSAAYALPLMRDLGHYMRDRFARYVAALRGYVEGAGLTGVPFVVNVHGTDRGRGLSFPIGISQLYEAYTQAPGYLAGSDHYLGDLTAANAPDLYLLNAFMEAVNRPEQPLTSVEFEAGDGDYGSDGCVRHDPSATDFKLRLCVAQGNRLVNLYLFAGGINYRLDEPVGDGNDRISFTGERHGIAAPVGPEGQLNATYPRLARTIRALTAVGDKLAVAREERDGVTVGFIPDYFMTESVYPESEAMKSLVSNLEANRFGGQREVMARAMLLAGYRYGCVDIQNRPLDPAATPVLALASARFMDGDVQAKLVDYQVAGGRLLLVGEVPLSDMEGAPCTILADRLGLRPAGERRASSRYHLSVTTDGWAAPRPELRAGWAQVFEPTTSDVLLRVYGADEACGFDLRVGDGRAIVVTAALPCDVEFFQGALERLGAAPGLAHGCPVRGIVLTSSATPAGERFVHLLNLDGFDKPLRLTDGGRELLAGREFVLRAREGMMLPFGVSVGPARVVRSTAEIAGVTDDAVMFRLTQGEDEIELESDRAALPSEEYVVESRGGRWIVTSRRGACGGVDRTEVVTVRFG
jgi:beta-galactosidase